jgi:hypothetical protein
VPEVNIKALPSSFFFYKAGQSYPSYRSDAQKDPNVHLSQLEVRTLRTVTIDQA